MGSHSITCHPADVTFPPLPQPKLVLDLATPERCKAELTWLVDLRWITRITVTHHGTNLARCWLTSLMRSTTPTTTPNRLPLGPLGGAKSFLKSTISQSLCVSIECKIQSAKTQSPSSTQAHVTKSQRATKSSTAACDFVPCDFVARYKVARK